MTTRKARWPVALQGAIAYFLCGSLFTWSVYREPLLKLFPSWNDGMLSIVFAVHNLFICAGIFIGGRLAQKISIRKLFFAFACMCLAGFGGICFLPVSAPGISFALLTLFFAVIASFGVGMSVNLIQSATLPWFPEHAGTMSGLLFMSLGISSFVLAALSRATLPWLGVRLSFGGIGIIIFAAAMLILADPKALLSPERTESAARTNEEGIPPKEMVKTYVFWLLLIWNGCMRAAGFILLDHAAGIAVAFAATALLGMLVSPAIGFGSLGLGSLLDKLRLRLSILSISLLMALSAALLILGGIFSSTILIIAGLILGGMAYGGSSGLDAASIKRVFGGKYFSANFGVANISMALGALLSSFSGIILDVYGGYMGVFIMTAALLIPILFCGISFQKVRMDRY